MCRLFVGLGSHHGDDQVGWKVAEAVAHAGLMPARQAAIPVDLLHWLEGVEELYLCDACSSQQPSGTVHRLTWQNGFPQVMALRSSNTHQMQLSEVLQLATSLNLLPARVILFAVEGKDFCAGQALSPRAEQARSVILQQLLQELHHA